jgi:EAL domain-containing protein (putative c-di-GMP-specific phosphodiesterase class I)
VHYQPIVRLKLGEIYGVEALLRWQHPTRGAIQPDQFIPLAEETGLIIPIGRWVLQMACRDGAVMHERFPRDEPLTISVNLSVRQLQSETIVADVQEALDLSGLPPSSLVLEITESVMLADTELAVRRLQDLKSLGVRLAMDDFGTGYSSLSYLRQLPIHTLKIDRSTISLNVVDKGGGIYISNQALPVSLTGSIVSIAGNGSRSYAVNGGSASASEIVAGALPDDHPRVEAHERASIAGDIEAMKIRAHGRK